MQKDDDDRSRPPGNQDHRRRAEIRDEESETGRTEYQAQADFEYKIFQRGSRRNRIPTIAGSGANGTMLHYDTNRDVCEDETLLLMDLGAKIPGLLRRYHQNVSSQRKIYGPSETGLRRCSGSKPAPLQKAAKPGMTLKSSTISQRMFSARGCVKQTDREERGCRNLLHARRFPSPRH